MKKNPLIISIFVLALLAGGSFFWFKTSTNEVKSEETAASPLKIQESTQVGAEATPPIDVPNPPAESLADVDEETHHELKQKFEELDDKALEDKIEEVDQTIVERELVEKANSQSLTPSETEEFRSLMRQRGALMGLKTERMLKDI